MQTEIKIKRHQSSHQHNRVIRCSSGKDLKQNTHDEKIRMKRALGKVNLLSEGVNLGLNEEEEL